MTELLREAVLSNQSQSIAQNRSRGPIRNARGPLRSPTDPLVTPPSVVITHSAVVSVMSVPGFTQFG